MTNKNASAGAATPSADTLTQLKDNTFLKSSQITKETRLEAYLNAPITRQNEILAALYVYGPMTAKQIAHAIHQYGNRQAVAPRLTELKAAGKVKVEKKVFDKDSNCHVALWEVV